MFKAPKVGKSIIKPTNVKTNATSQQQSQQNDQAKTATLTVGKGALTVSNVIGKVSADKKQKILGGSFGNASTMVIIKKAPSVSTMSKAFSAPITTTMLPVAAAVTKYAAVTAMQSTTDLQSAGFVAMIPQNSKTHDALSSRGISSLRPEIICSINTEPAYSATGQQTAAARLFDAYVSAQALRIERISSLIAQLSSNPQTIKLLDKIIKSTLERLEQTKKDVSAQRQIVAAIDRAARSLTIRENFAVLDAHTAQLSSTLGIQKWSIRDLFVGAFGFSQYGYEQFMNTKLLLQLLYDTWVTLSLYTQRLLTQTNVNVQRLTDVNKSSINFSVNINTKLSFSVFSSAPPVKFASIAFVDFKKIASIGNLKSLDRAKLLMVLLSKELRVSSGMNSQQSVDVIKRLGLSTTGDQFKAIIGMPGNTVFDGASSGSTIASLALLKSNIAGMSVLSFEHVTFTASAQKFITGVDSLVKGALIANSDEAFNVASFTDYVDAFNSIVNDLNSFYVATYGETSSDDVNDVLTCKGIVTHVLSQLVGIMQWVGTTEEQIAKLVGLQTKQHIQLAIFKLASSMPSLRHALFRYIVSSQAAVSKQQAIPTAFSSIDQISVFGAGEVADVLDDIVGSLIAMPDNESDALKAQQQDTSYVSLVTSLSSKEIVNAIDNADAGTVIKAIITTVEKLFSASQLRANNVATPGGFLTTDGLTRLNGVSVASIIAFVLETYIALIDAFVDITMIKAFTLPNDQAFKSAAGLTLFNVIVNPKQNAGAFKALSAVLSFGAISPQWTFEEISAYTNINAFFLSIANEDIIAQQCINLIRAIAASLSSAGEDLRAALDPDGKNSDFINGSLKSTDDAKRVSMLSSMQVAVSTSMLSELETGISTNQNALGLPAFIDSGIITLVMKDAVHALLRYPAFVGQNNASTRIVSVGIPAGMSDVLFSLKQSVNNILNAPLAQSRIIKLMFYRKSEEFEHLIFRPIVRRFEIDRFVSSLLYANRADLIGKLTTLNDVIDSVDMHVINGSGESIINARGKQSVATYEQSLGTELLTNHVISWLLGVYVRTTMGIDANEGAFSADSNVLTNALDDESMLLFSSIVNAHIASISGVNPSSIEGMDDITELFKATNSVIGKLGKQISLIVPGASKAVNSALTEDVVDFIKSYAPNTMLTGMSMLYRSIVEPKLFERVFNVPIDIDDFVIDTDATTSTKAGADTFKIVQANDRFFSNTVNDVQQYRLKPSDAFGTNVIVDDIFVIVGTDV